MIGKVEVKGLAQMSRALKKLDSDLPKAMRVALNGASQHLIDKAKPKIPTRTGAARASLKARSTRTMVRVSAGGPKARYYPFLDFGGRVGRNRSVRRPFFSDGRYLYPTLGEERERVVDILQVALVRVARDAGLGVD